MSWTDSANGLAIDRVAELSDPRLADYVNLKDAELLLRRGRFIVEGRGNLRVLLSQSAFRPESLLLSEAACEAMRGELEAWARGIPIFVGAQAVLDGVVGFKIHRGALAACLRPRPLEPSVLIAELLARDPAPVVVVLEDVRDADNVGAVFRNAMALGGRGVFLAAKSCDPLYRKAIRTSMGGALRVPFARTDDLPGLLGELLAAGFEVLAFDPKPGATPVGELAREARRPCAILVGTEGEGLTQAALAHSSRRVRIPMEPGVDSLNVATAVAIGLHALSTARHAGADGG